MKSFFKRVISLFLAVVCSSCVISNSKTNAAVNIKSLNKTLISFHKSLSQGLNCKYNSDTHRNTAKGFINFALKLVHDAYIDINKCPCRVEKEYDNNRSVIYQYVVKPLKDKNDNEFFRCFDIPEDVLLENAQEPSNINPIISLGTDVNGECLCLVENLETKEIFLKSYNVR